MKVARMKIEMHVSKQHQKVNTLATLFVTLRVFFLSWPVVSGVGKRNSNFSLYFRTVMAVYLIPCYHLNWQAN